MVVLTKDRPDLMMDLREGLLKQKRVELRVLVLDNGDEPETSRLVNEWSRLHETGISLPFLSEPQWMLLKSKIDGYGHGINMAVETLNGWPRKEQVPLLLLNNDVRLLDPFLFESLAHHLGPARTGIVGVRLLDDAGLINHDGTSFSNGLPMHLGRGQQDEESVCGLTPATTFACALIDRELFTSLNGLDEGYGWGYEDTDFCLRAAELGYLTVTCRRASAVHNEFGTRERGGDVKEAQRFYGKWNVTGRGAKALQRFQDNVSDKGV